MRKMWAAGAAFATCLVLGGLPTAGQDASPGAMPEPTTANRDGQTISDLVGKAWTTGAETDVDAIYYADAVLELDGEQMARGRAELMDEISGTIDLGNTYSQIGPVIEYRDRITDDLYVGSITEVNGPGHRWGDPLVCFFRAHGGMVTHHVCMLASGY